ncbi:MAG: 3D domain-containing protein [Firmicutes bacterium]|jgi:uncharacterized protein YabE (DUF348 family)|nr:3D domain-containing protein [Bacillota bacterium]
MIRLRNIMKNQVVFSICIISFMAMLLFVLRTTTLKEVTVIDIDKKYIISTTKSNINAILKENNIDIHGRDKLSVAFNSKVKDGDQVRIIRAYPIFLQDGKDGKTIETTEISIGNILKENNIEVDDNDIVFPSLDDNIGGDRFIKISRIEEEIITEKVDKKYETVFKLVSDLKPGEIEKVSDGKNGLSEITYKLVYEDGDFKSKEIVKEKIIEESQSEIVKKGMDKLFVTNRGMPFRYKEVIIMEATAYDLSYESCGKYPDHPEYGITYSGTRAKPGVVAVDPRVVPLRSKLYVESLDSTRDYGFSSAEDTGSAIKGNKIDLFIGVKKDALRYGRRKVRVYVLDDDVPGDKIVGYGK